MRKDWKHLTPKLNRLRLQEEAVHFIASHTTEQLSLIFFISLLVRKAIAIETACTTLVVSMLRQTVAKTIMKIRYTINFCHYFNLAESCRLCHRYHRFLLLLLKHFPVHTWIDFSATIFVVFNALRVLSVSFSLPLAQRVDEPKTRNILFVRSSVVSFFCFCLDSVYCCGYSYSRRLPQFEVCFSFTFVQPMMTTMMMAMMTVTFVWSFRTVFWLFSNKLITLWVFVMAMSVAFRLKTHKGIDLLFESFLFALVGRIRICFVSCRFDTSNRTEAKRKENEMRESSCNMISLTVYHYECCRLLKRIAIDSNAVQCLFSIAQTFSRILCLATASSVGQFRIITSKNISASNGMKIDFYCLMSCVRLICFSVCSNYVDAFLLSIFFFFRADSLPLLFAYPFCIWSWVLVSNDRIKQWSISNA